MTENRSLGRPAGPPERVKGSRLSIPVTSAMAARLRHAATQAGVTDSEIVRLALETELTKREGIAK